MKPLNREERSKLVWQFAAIFFGLFIVPFAVFCFAFYETPLAISDADQAKLDKFNDFEKTQKAFVKQIADIDSNIRLLNNSNGNVDLIKSDISKRITDLPSDNTLAATMKKVAGSYYDVSVSYYDSKANNKKLQDQLNNTSTQLQSATNDLKQAATNQAMISAAAAAAGRK